MARIPSVTLPVPADLRRVLRRLVREERSERRTLARLEARLRRFEDVERPAYDAWLRLELGPAVADIEELAATLRARQRLAERVTELVEDAGLHPREALWVVREGGPEEARSAGAEGREAREARQRDEIEARRRAKRERKRAERKRAQREGREARRRGAGAAAAMHGGEVGSARRLVAIYRDLARALHPDSPTVVRALAPARLRAVWAEVQAAYAMRSLERLLALASWLETVAARGVDAEAPEADAREPGASSGGRLSLAERHDRLRALRRAARALDRRLAALAGEPAWDFPAALPPRRRALKQVAARRLAGERAAMRAALAAVDDFLDGIGPPRPPRVGRGRH